MGRRYDTMVSRYDGEREFARAVVSAMRRRRAFADTVRCGRFRGVFFVAGNAVWAACRTDGSQLMGGGGLSVPWRRGEEAWLRGLGAGLSRAQLTLLAVGDGIAAFAHGADGGGGPVFMCRNMNQLADWLVDWARGGEPFARGGGNAGQHA